jgi:CRP-like cAMP-binding protein/Zn-dependent protease
MSQSTTSTKERIPDDSPASLGGVWDALLAHVNPTEYRPVRSPDVSAVPLVSRRGQPYYILANRRHATYLRLTPEDYYLWNLMDGARSMNDLLFEYFTKFGALAFDRVAQLVLHLRQDHMLVDAALDLYASLRKKLQKSRNVARVCWEVLSGQRVFKIRHIDGAVEAFHQWVGWLFYTPPMQILYVGLSVVGGWFFVQHLASGRYPLFQAGGSYTKGLLLLFLLNSASIMVHEASHALTCKHYGAHVNSGGCMLYYGMPAFFVDTTDVWTKPSRARIATSWAGPYSGLILAGLGAIIVQAFPDSRAAPVLHRLSFLWILILLFNLIPLLELDGYFMLIDWLELPLLRARAVAFFSRELWRRLRRREPLKGEDRLLAWYGALSVTVSIAFIALGVLSWRYRFRALTQVLWSGGMGSKALLVLLLLLLSLPLMTGLGSQALSATRTASRWTRHQLRRPHGWTLRERETLLCTVRFLSPLSAAELSEIASRMAHHSFRPGEIVYRRGTEADRFYVIERGVAEVLLWDERVPYRYLTRGDYFGEHALLERVGHLATVRADGRLSVLSLGRGDFDRLLGTHVATPPSPVVEKLHACMALTEFPLFARLSSRELDAVAARLVRERFSPGAVIFEEGQAGDAFYLVESGQAEVLVGGQRIGTLARGSCFGETALLLNRPRMATVRALTPLDVFTLRRPDFEALTATALRKEAAAMEVVARSRLNHIRRRLGRSMAGRRRRR